MQVQMCARCGDSALSLLSPWAPPLPPACLPASPQLSHSERCFSCGADLLGAFKAKEYSVTPYYSGPLSFGQSLSIQVRH